MVSHANGLASSNGPGGTESAGRVLDVLLRFLDAPDTLGISQLAREMGVSKSVIHRAFKTLSARNLVQFDTSTRQYRLGDRKSVV